jgi:fumarylacetoacetase
MSLDRTHESSATSWVSSANQDNTDFPIQNLPHGVFSTKSLSPRGGVRIGDEILDFQAALDKKLFSSEIEPIARAAAQADLGQFMAMGNEASLLLRLALFDLLKEDSAESTLAQQHQSSILVSIADAKILMPLEVKSFIDFMTSIYHTTSARKSRPARPLHVPSLHIPVGYNSRASSLIPSGVDFSRPYGQIPNEDEEVVFQPSQKLDFEVEFGAIVGKEIPLSSPIHIDQAEDHIFGYMMVNDWSARDIQLYEMRLGPFLGKSFRSTISPWIVTTHALKPFQCNAKVREAHEPPYPAHLDSPKNSETGGFNIALDGFIQTPAMKEAGEAPFRIVQTHLKHLSWTLNQMLTHIVSNGCNADTGDIFSSGTVSGPEEEQAACLFEKTAGTLPFDLPNGEQRIWLGDGDTFSMKAVASMPGYKSIGFGDCSATVLPATKKWF